MHPFNTNDLELKTAQIEQLSVENPEELYFKREVIGQSIEGRPVDLLTISSPEAIEEDKPVVFMTSRVHAGETPASFMMQGVLDMLTVDL